MRIKSLSISDALGILDTLDSSEDPIIWRGREITPQDLNDHYTYDYTLRASSIKITFYSSRHKKVTGSLYTMVVCRLTER